MKILKAIQEGWGGTLFLMLNCWVAIAILTAFLSFATGGTKYGIAFGVMGLIGFLYSSYLFGRK